MQFRAPQLMPIVKKLLIINVSVFMACIIIKPLGDFIYDWFSVNATSPAKMMQLWRLLGYQFLHARGSIGHIAFNMLALYFLGPTLERHWGSKRFLKFYLCCGTVGGVFYILLVAFGALPGGMLIGASGAILGMLAACAILFPQFVVFLIVFPVPIRVAAVVFTLFYVFSIFTKGHNAGGDAAHLAGMAAGAFYVYLWPRLKGGKTSNIASRFKAQTLAKKMDEYKRLQAEVDRILEKVNTRGINSLSGKEKKILSEATKLEQMRNSQ